ncbi:MAG: phosphotriesterase family protein [Bacillota bacterium]
MGQVNANELGRTLYHEHFVFGFPGFQGDTTLGEFDREAALQAGITQAEKIIASGIKTVVDATPNDCGRNPELLKEISARTGLQIVCATGYYFEEDSASAYFKYRAYWGDVEKEIVEMFRKEVNEGIGRSGIRAGVIKLASSKDVITDYEKVFFRAAAKVQKESGVTIITHTQQGTMGLEQAELLISEGADPGRVAIGHMCCNTNIADHLKVLKTGVFIGFDRFGFERISGAPPDVLREAMLIGLIGIGYENKILLSQDSECYVLGRPVIWPEHLKKRIVNWHPTHIMDDVVPILKTAGITEEQIEILLAKNPQRLFGA